MYIMVSSSIKRHNFFFNRGILLRTMSIYISLKWDILMLFICYIFYLDLATGWLFICCEIWWCIKCILWPFEFCLGSYFWLFMAMNTYFYDPLNSGLISFWLQWQFHGPFSLVVYVSWPFNFDVYINFHGHENRF